MVGAKSLQRQMNSRSSSAWSLPEHKTGRAVPFLVSAVKYFCLVPVFPLLGFYMLDQTGFSHWLVAQGLIPVEILGEGFGHVGLCFSIHYVFTGFRELFRAIRLFFP